MIIRQYDPERDHDEVDLLESEVFSSQDNLYDEGDGFLEYLRSTENYVPELELIAEDEGGRIIGHILLTPHMLETPFGPTEILYLSPLSVIMDMQRKGIGSALVRDSIRIAEELGYRAVFLVGEPAFYSRLGFVPASRYGISSLEEVPDEVLLCYVIADDFMESIHEESDA